MKRRAVISAFMAFACSKLGRAFQTVTDGELSLLSGAAPAESYTVLALDIDAKAAKETYGISIRYKGREVLLTMDEIMDALDARPIRSGK